MKMGAQAGAGCQTALGEPRHSKPRPAAGAYLLSKQQEKIIDTSVSRKHLDATASDP
jgi:hypothetical protein